MFGLKNLMERKFNSQLHIIKLNRKSIWRYIWCKSNYKLSSVCINKSTINTRKPAVVSLSGSNLTFDLTLNNTGQNGYQLQIEKLAPPDTSFNSFSSIVLSCTITKDGWFTKIGAVDNYNITQTVSVKVTSVVSYVFSYYTDNDITTNVMQSLTVKKKDKAAQTSVNGYKFDIVSNLIYGN